MSDELAPEHPAHAYMRLNAALKAEDTSDEAKYGWKVPVKRHALSRDLSALQWEVACDDKDAPSLKTLKLVALEDEKDLGTLDAVDLPTIQTLATPSSFGKGSETVFDETVRKGTEVPAAKIGLASDGQAVLAGIATTIGQKLFPGQPVKLVFYKLAIYGQEGHFARHRDTTHGDAHHGTLLLGCHPRDAPDYKGGAFVLYLDGDEKEYFLKPDSWLAFYTDVEHSVDPVQDGVRLTLQFDIFLEDETRSRPHTVACVPAQEAIGNDAEGQKAVVEGKSDGGDDDNENEGDDDDMEGDDDDDDDDDDNDNYDVDKKPQQLLVNPFRDNDYNGERRKPGKARVDTLVPKLIALLKKARPDAPPPAKKPRRTGWGRDVEMSIPKKPRTVAFLLRHMYRQQSLRPEYLKGLDHALYHALVEAEPTLRIVMLPVYVQLRCLASEEDAPKWHQDVVIAHPRAEELKQLVPEPVAFIRRFDTGAGLVEHANGAAYTGNESLEEKYKYLAGAMFISLA